MTKRRAIRFALRLLVAAAIDATAFWWHFLRDPKSTTSA